MSILHGRILKGGIEEQLTDSKKQSGFRHGRSCAPHDMNDSISKTTKRRIFNLFIES